MSHLWGNNQPPFGIVLNSSHPLAQGLNTAVILNGPVACHTDKITGSKFAVAGAPTNNTGIKGLGIRFPATNDLLSNTTFKTVGTNTPVSLFVICRVEDTTNTNRKRAIRLFGATNGTSAQIEFAGTSNNNIMASIQYSAGLFETTDDTAGVMPYSANQDYALGMTWEPGDLVRLYVDGFQHTTSANTRTTITESNGGLNLGGNTSGGGLNLRGTLYCAYHWTRALTPNEMWRLYAKPYDMFGIRHRRTITKPGTAGVRRNLPLMGMG